MFKIIQKIQCKMGMHRGREIRQTYGLTADGYFICSYCPSIESELIWEGCVEEYHKITMKEARKMVLKLKDTLTISYDDANDEGTLTRSEYKAIRKDHKQLIKRFMKHVGEWKPTSKKG